MPNKSKLFFMITVTALLLFTTSCGAGSTSNATPTVDANTIYTQAAQTVAAGLAKSPTLAPTKAPATNTVAPTNPPSSSVTQSAITPTNITPITQLTVTPGIQITRTTLTPGSGGATLPAVVSPTATTQRTAPPPAADKCEYISQEPGDGTEYAPNTVFTMHWTLKNTGATTWLSNYGVKMYAGEKFGDDTTLKIEVKPGEIGKVSVQMKVPDKTGKLYSLWVLQNNDGRNFCQFDITIESK
ncbi:MAG TPA: NBR1-Ig-like domain-containing protein [Anaerolineaceae bacterium]